MLLSYSLWTAACKIEGVDYSASELMCAGSRGGKNVISMPTKSDLWAISEQFSQVQQTIQRFKALQDNLDVQLFVATDEARESQKPGPKLLNHPHAIRAFYSLRRAQNCSSVVNNVTTVTNNGLIQFKY